MQKIISLFQRNYDGDRLVRDELVPGAEWVAEGEGVATVKWDGTACMVRDGRLFKRYDAKPGRTPPAGFEQSGEPDSVTGRVQGWVPVGDGPEDRWHREAFSPVPIDGTYELCGPKIQGNPHKLSAHVLIPHGRAYLSQDPRTYADLKAYFTEHKIEGIVWHHPDGRMVKVKAKDFGLRWPAVEQEGTDGRSHDPKSGT
jgi:hypothetical protein